MNAEEKEYLLGISNDDRESFHSLFSHYYPKTVVFLSSILKDDKDAAEDLAQDIFLKIWLSRSALSGIADFGAYLYVMTKNSALMYLRRKKHQTVSIDELDLLIDQAIEEQCTVKENLEYIQAVVSKMPPKRRKIYIMSREQGMSNDEIAKELNIKKKTVENHLNLALSEIRRILVAVIFFI